MDIENMDIDKIYELLIKERNKIEYDKSENDRLLLTCHKLLVDITLNQYENIKQINQNKNKISKLKKKSKKNEKNKFLHLVESIGNSNYAAKINSLLDEIYDLEDKQEALNEKKKLIETKKQYYQNENEKISERMSEIDNRIDQIKEKQPNFILEKKIEKSYIKGMKK